MSAGTWSFCVPHRLKWDMDFRTLQSDTEAHDRPGDPSQTSPCLGRGRPSAAAHHSLPISTRDVRIWTTDSDCLKKSTTFQRTSAGEQIVGLRRIRRHCHPSAASVLLRATGRKPLRERLIATRVNPHGRLVCITAAANKPGGILE